MIIAESISTSYYIVLSNLWLLKTNAYVVLKEMKGKTTVTYLRAIYKADAQ